MFHMYAKHVKAEINSLGEAVLETVGAALMMSSTKLRRSLSEYFSIVRHHGFPHNYDDDE